MTESCRTHTGPSKALRPGRAGPGRGLGRAPKPAGPTEPSAPGTGGATELTGPAGLTGPTGLPGATLTGLTGLTGLTEPPVRRPSRSPARSRRPTGRAWSPSLSRFSASSSRPSRRSG
ncbi:hypothetical protein SFRA_019785 [Streptomyces xinghaiensis]|uniref:Uncharacterized protein n=1 Tax=Streptomyces xinghaiensis TaxID=1038928 RepID=A0A420V0J8_9ACTN|nr:hypothetical protein SFRA_019785 [Streptomyces xinghaiensis]RNC69247.1 hypothetical protein DC095_029785 [Streptomyces xinghaiensis]